MDRRRSEPGFSKVPYALMREPDLTPRQHLVVRSLYAALHMLSDHHTGRVHPRHGKGAIMAAASITNEAAFYRARQLLIDRGYLHVRSRQGRRSEYVLLPYPATGELREPTRPQTASGSTPDTHPQTASGATTDTHPQSASGSDPQPEGGTRMQIVGGPSSLVRTSSEPSPDAGGGPSLTELRRALRTYLPASVTALLEADPSGAAKVDDLLRQLASLGYTARAMVASVERANPQPLDSARLPVAALTSRLTTVVVDAQMLHKRRVAERKTLDEQQRRDAERAAYETQRALNQDRGKAAFDSATAEQQRQLLREARDQLRTDGVDPPAAPDPLQKRAYDRAVLALAHTLALRATEPGYEATTI